MAKGEVVLEKGNHYVVDTGATYCVIEWHGGSVPSVGDNLVGDLESHGFKDIYNMSNRSESQVYIEDYLLDEEEAIEMAYELNS